VLITLNRFYPHLPKIAQTAGIVVTGVLGTMERRVRLSHWFSRGSADSALGLVFRATKYT
jgi:hypothetical protein